MGWESILIGRIVEWAQRCMRGVAYGARSDIDTLYLCFMTDGTQLAYSSKVLFKHVRENLHPGLNIDAIIMSQLEDQCMRTLRPELYEGLELDWMVTTETATGKEAMCVRITGEDVLEQINLLVARWGEKGLTTVTTVYGPSTIGSWFVVYKDGDTWVGGGPLFKQNFEPPQKRSIFNG